MPDADVSEGTWKSRKEILNEVEKVYPFRSAEVAQIDNCFADYLDVFPPAVFIWGFHNVGKSCVTKLYLELTNTKYVMINCVECTSQKLLFQLIVNQLLPCSYQDRSCDLLQDFIMLVKNAYTSGDLTDDSVVIVFDGIEHLYDMSPLLVPPLLRLQELIAKTNLGLIFISHHLPTQFDIDLDPVVSIPFPQYTRDQAFAILSKGKPEGVTDQFYTNYLNGILSTIYWISRDIVVLKATVDYNFKKYCEPIETGLLSPNDTLALWSNISQQVQDSLNVIMGGCGSDKAPGSLDLPYYAKFFLIAAFLASNNAAKYDRRLYQKEGGKRKKKPVKEPTTLQFSLAPRVFPLDRLLAIFYSITDGQASLTANLLAEISTLCELHLLRRMSEFSLDNPRFKCLVGFPTVDAVAKTVDFNLKKYLIE